MREKCFEFNILGILIFQEVLTEFNFSTKFPVLKKFVNLVKDLKYECQIIFPLWGRVKLNLGIGREKTFFVRTQPLSSFFTKLTKNTGMHKWD